MAQLPSLTQTNRDYKLVRTDGADRCEYISSAHVQCPYQVLPDSKFCPKHSRLTKSKNLKNYNLQKFRTQVSNFATNPALKSLREEIGILRLLLETIINRCNDEYDLIMQSVQIANTVDKIDKLVNSCHKLEIQTDELLDRNKAMQLADSIIEILTSELKDEETVAKVSIRIAALFGNI